MDFRVVALLLIAVVFLAFLLLVYVSGRHSVINRVYCIFIANMTLWAFSLAMFYTCEGPVISLFWSKVVYLAGSIIPAAFLHFSFVFPAGSFRPWQLALYLPNVVLGLLYFLTPWILNGVDTFEGAKGFLYGPGRILWDLQFNSMFGFGFYRFVRFYQTSAGITRLRLRYVVLGTFVGLTLAGTTNVIMPWFNRFELLWLGPPLTLTWLGSIVYAITRYRLLDVTVAVARTAVFTVVYALLLGMPLIGALTWQAEFERILGSRWWVWLWMVSAGLATVAHYINLYFQRQAEASLLREQRRYQATLMNAARGMVSIRDLRRLLRLIAYLLTRAMKLSHAEIFIWDQKAAQYVQPAYHLKGKKDAPVAVVPMEDAVIKWLLDDRTVVVAEELATRPEETKRAQTLKRLRDLKAAVVVPSFINARLIGFVVLGQKRNGRMFSQDDLNVLQTLASQAALAIENARFFEELQSTQAQLFQSEKMAALGRMGAGMSHQLHNRFQALLKNSGDLLHIELPKMLKQPSWSPEQRQQLETFVGSLQGIEREAGKGAEIVRKLVKFARLSPGDQLVDVHDVITEAIGMLQFTAKLETIDLVYDLPASLPKIRGNATFLQDIFFNLTDNGWQAIETKHQELAAGRLPDQSGVYKGIIAITASHVAAQRKIKITVHDNGIGMTKEQLARLFEPFFSTKSSVGHGTGLGLFIVKKMVEEAHQGTIEAASTYGVGTSFILHFPAVGP